METTQMSEAQVTCNLANELLFENEIGCDRGMGRIQGAGIPIKNVLQ